jgi:medium-chain acyl-[acyl-carrier-protein] hydrolase
MRTTDMNDWLSCRELRPQPRLRLFCFPFAGGSASAYRGWSAGLPKDVEVCPIQLPGREARFAEPAFRNIADLVPVLADVLSPLIDLPFAFYGHSMGSLVAFELAHELRGRGMAQPLALYPAAHEAPKYPHITAISQLPDDELIAYVGKVSNTPEVLDNPQLLQLILPTLRSDLSVCDFYVFRPRAKLECAITAFGGREDRIPRAALEAWGEETEGTSDVEMLPGGHLFLSASRAQLLDILAQRLAALTG